MSKLIEPALNAASVTPADSTNLTSPTRALYIGSGGDLAVVLNGTTVTFTNVASGSVLPIRPEIVNSTNTTATDILALW